MMGTMLCDRLTLTYAVVGLLVPRLCFGFRTRRRQDGAPMTYGAANAR